MKDILFNLKTTYTGEISKFGLGTLIYFKFLKVLTIYFFILQFLSIPILYLTYNETVKSGYFD